MPQLSYVQREEIDTLKISLATLRCDPRVESEQALEDLVLERVVPTTPYEELALTIFAYSDNLRTDERVAAGHVLALGRKRHPIYSSFLAMKNSEGVILDQLDQRQHLLRDALDEIAEGLDGETMRGIAFYFESKGEFELAARAAQQGGCPQLTKMYLSLARLKTTFSDSGVAN